MSRREPSLLRRYRAMGADLPWGDLCAAHGVPMEGYFWRFTDALAGRVVVALCGVSRSPKGAWATVAVAGHPGGFAREAVTSTAAVDGRALGVRAGGAFAAQPGRVRLELGPDARLDVRILDGCEWPRRALGGCGAAHLIPALGQYWHPHLLGGRAVGQAVLGDEVIDLDGAHVYAEKNWGRGFPEQWWWGQAQGFERPDVCVAFAGGDVAIGRAGMRPTAVVVRVGATVIRLGDPLLSPVRAEVGDGRWKLSGRGPRWSVEAEGRASVETAHVLPVPLPAERRSVPGALEHLAAPLRLVVRRRGRVVFAGESALAGLEHGGLERADAELRRRAARGEETHEADASRVARR
jgi:hypothetical protein